MITIALVENSLNHQRIIEGHLKTNAAYKLLVVANNGFEMLKYCFRNKQLPQIALIDIEMDTMDGISLMDFLAQYYPEIKCIALTSHYHKQVFEDAISCGAIGLANKIFTAEDHQLARFGWDKNKFSGIDICVEAAMENRFWVEEKMNVLSNNVIKELDRNALLAHRKKQIERNAAFKLTPIEYKILMLCASITIELKYIAELLSMSVPSLKACLSDIYKKIGIRNKTDLMLFAFRKSFIKTCRDVSGIEQI